MTEQETTLIRDYLLIDYLIKEAVLELDRLKHSAITLKGMLIQATKIIGTRLNDKLRDTRIALSKLGYSVRVEDEGALVYVCTTHKGAQKRYPMKREILIEECEIKFGLLMKEFMNDKLEPYKPNMRTFGDQYAQK